MFKNQLQELAQRSCFNLPSYTCVREGPDHAPRFKASVNFNGEIFDSPTYCTTLRQAEHAAAEVALNALSTSGPSRSLTARVLDETGVYKNLLQETAHRAGLNLPVYTTVRSGPGHLPVFTSTVELAGLSFAGESAKTKKQAEKNAAIAAWSALKTRAVPNIMNSLSRASKESQNGDQMMTVALCTGPKDATCCRVIRNRYHNQSKRRLMVRRSCGDNTDGSCKSKNKDDAERQQWKLMDLFIDISKEGFSSERKKQNWLASLLPPPPPRTTSKILPPTCSSSPPDHSKTKPITALMDHFEAASSSTPGNQRGKMQEKDDPHHIRRFQEEWMNQEKNGPSGSRSSSSATGKACLARSSGELDSNRVSNSMPQTNPPQVALLPPPIKVSYRCTSPVEELGIMSYNSSGYGYHQRQRIALAPAVQIRSVIPVCAAPPAPPMRRPSLSLSSSSLTPDPSEVILTKGPASSRGGAEGSLTLTGLQSGSTTTELSAKFSKLRL